jgi:ferredoxin-type protein NapG
MGWLARLRQRMGAGGGGDGDRERGAEPAQRARDEEPLDRAAFLREGRGVLKQMGARLGQAVLGGAAERLVPALVRPPGAVEEGDFFTRCTRCDACIDACHQGVILRADGRLGIQVGTPYLDIEGHLPCYLCSRPPCAAACPTGALIPLTQAEIRLGVAQVLPDLCLTWQGEGAQGCDKCQRACPVPGAVLVAPDGRVIIDDAACVGCGICFHACPMSPPALRIVPPS